MDTIRWRLEGEHVGVVRWDRVDTAIWAVTLVLVAAIAVASWAAARRPTTLRARYGLAQPNEWRAGKTALVLVDFQEEFLRGGLPLPEAREAVDQAAALAAWARRSGILVVMVQNESGRADSPLFRPGAEMTQLVGGLRPAPGDLLVRKALGGAFSRTNLDVELRARGVDALIVGGFMTHLAVSITANDAYVLGYRVVVAADATATRTLPAAGGGGAVDAATLQKAALAALADRAADVWPVPAIMALPVAH